MNSGKNKKRVVAVGIFDLLHPGHIHYLTQARKLGDELWVLVTQDEIARREKRPPVFPQDARVFLLEHLAVVDRALVWTDGGAYETLKKIKPDIMALGYDQPYHPKKLERDFADHGLAIKVVRIGRFRGAVDSSSKIIDNIKRRKT